MSERDESVKRKRQTRKQERARGAPKADTARLLPTDDKLLGQLDRSTGSLKLTVEAQSIALTKLDKELWTGSAGKAKTKRDYALYLLSVAPVLLDHLKDRPLTLIRYPNGISGQKFFQKHWQRSLPEYVETVRYFSEHTGRDQDYLLCNNLPTLIWLAQIASLELHTVHSRTVEADDGLEINGKFTGSVSNIESSLLDYPDYLIVDLDPYIYSGKEKPGEEPELHRQGFRKTCEVALALKELLDALKIKSFPKTSGKTGLHIYIPIVRNLHYDTVREIAETIGRHLLSEMPDLVTMEWRVPKRSGKVFFDHNMNARGKTLPAPYSVRNTPDATVSTPLSWRELDQIYPTDFTISTVPDRLFKSGDIWGKILENKNDLVEIFGKVEPGVDRFADLNVDTKTESAKEQKHRSGKRSSRVQKSA